MPYVWKPKCNNDECGTCRWIEIHLETCSKHIYTCNKSIQTNTHQYNPIQSNTNQYKPYYNTLTPLSVLWYLYPSPTLILLAEEDWHMPFESFHIKLLVSILCFKPPKFGITVLQYKPIPTNINQYKLICIGWYWFVFVWIGMYWFVLV